MPEVNEGVISDLIKTCCAARGAGLARQAKILQCNPIDII